MGPQIADMTKLQNAPAFQIYHVSTTLLLILFFVWQFDKLKLRNCGADPVLKMINVHLQQSTYSK